MGILRLTVPALTGSFVRVAIPSRAFGEGRLQLVPVDQKSGW